MPVRPSLREIGLIGVCALATASCERATPQPAAPALRAAASGAVADRPRITGGRQPALAAEPLTYPVSGPSPLASGCEGPLGGGVVYLGAEVEPSLAAHPANPNILVGAWQQDRWSNGSARALVAATSLDGGRNWTLAPLPFSRCGGGTVVNGGDYQRASDPWVTYSPNGVVHAMSLSTNGGVFQAGGTNAMLASRSFDHGRTWTHPTTLILDGEAAFNDKNAMTADPHDANYVYAVWDRLIAATDRGPTYFARSTNGGASWEAARPIFDPGAANQTIGNIVAVLSNGVLLNVFNRIDSPPGGLRTSRIAVVRSLDRGQTWSQPVYIAEQFAVGTRDPVSGTAVRDGSIVPTIAAGPNGEVYVAWQDSRFTGGVHDGIALSRSSDGGLSWSTPVRVNGAPAVPAFTPSLHVAADGTVGVSYYDLRNDTATAPLSTDAWLARSRDGGATWTDLRLGATFDLAQAPFANGLFVGDYTGLVSVGGRFLPFYARVNAGETTNRTDVVAVSLAQLPSPAPKRPTAAARAETQSRLAPAAFLPSHALRLRVDANLRRRLKHPPEPGAPERFMPHFATLALLQR
ncbi:MAG: exo-alpha-sialidase [Pseudomonadota bacterium]